MASGGATATFLEMRRQSGFSAEASSMFALQVQHRNAVEEREKSKD